MQDFIDVVILYNEDFVKAGNTWVRNLRCLPWAPSTTAPVVIRHENYVDARQKAREDGLMTQAKKEHDIGEKPYTAWVKQKKVLADNNDTAGLDAHLLREPAHGATIDQRYQTLRAAAIPPINRAPYATAVPIGQLATHFRGPLSPTCTAAVWRINTIGELLRASEAAQRQVDDEYNLLMDELEADDIKIDESRSNNEIAQQDPDELAMWLIFNSDRELQLLRIAAGISIDAVKRHLSMSSPPPLTPTRTSLSAFPSLFLGTYFCTKLRNTVRIPTELNRLGNLARGLAPGPDVHRWNLPQSPTNQRPCVPTGISSCLPSVTSFCSGARTVPVQGSRQVHYVFLGATLEDHESWPEVRVIRRQQRIAFTRDDKNS